MLSKSILHSIVVFSSCTLAAGCFDSKSSKDEGPPPTRFSLAVTDAPIDNARHVVVEFSTVVLQPSDSERIEFRFEEPMRIDLLALQGLNSQYLVVDKEIPAGDYDWIRLGVNANLDGVMDSYIELRSGAQLELVIPSGDETGLKLNGGFVLQEGAEADFTIDFDLRRSVAIPAHLDTASAVLRPSLRMVDTVFSGSIEGEINESIIVNNCEDPSLDPGAVYIFEYTAEPRDVQGIDGGPLISALVHYHDGGYHYEAGFVPPGSYNVMYTCDAALDAPNSQEDLHFVPAHAEATPVTLAENVVLNFPSDATAPEPFTPETNDGTEQDPPATEIPVAESPTAPVNEQPAPAETPAPTAPTEHETEDSPITEVPVAEPPAEPVAEPTDPSDSPTPAAPAEEAPEQEPSTEEPPGDESPAEPQLPVLDILLPVLDELLPTPAPQPPGNNGNQAEQPDNEETDSESEDKGEDRGRGKDKDKDKGKNKDDDSPNSGRGRR